MTGRQLILPILAAGRRNRELGPFCGHISVGMADFFSSKVFASHYANKSYIAIEVDFHTSPYMF